jgi:hypothetical protein
MQTSYISWLMHLEGVRLPDHKALLGEDRYDGGDAQGRPTYPDLAVEDAKIG